MKYIVGTIDATFKARATNEPLSRDIDVAPGERS
jgi:hypothetical protein